MNRIKDKRKVLKTLGDKEENLLKGDAHGVGFLGSLAGHKTKVSCSKALKERPLDLRFSYPDIQILSNAVILVTVFSDLQVYPC